MANERNAGRKKSFTQSEIENFIKRREKGETVTSIARSLGVSRQTVSAYFAEDKRNRSVVQIDCDGGTQNVCHLLKYWIYINENFLSTKKISANEIEKYNLRYEYMNRDKLMSEILVNPKEKRVAVINHSDDIIHLAFGVNKLPTWDDFLSFIKERCFPEGRAYMKCILQDIHEASFDVFSITEKMSGVMAEDHQWFRIIHFTEEMPGGKEAKNGNFYS